MVIFDFHVARVDFVLVILTSIFDPSMCDGNLEDFVNNMVASARILNCHNSLSV